MSSAIFQNLNPQQTEAVRTVGGPVMAVAGAGSGKTRVLTNRIAYLIDDVGIPPSHILAITFTNRAAEEMRNRIFKMTTLNLSGIWISTFHSMGAKILRLDIHHLGYKSDFQIIDDDDSVAVVKKMMIELNYDPKQFSPKAIAGAIEDAKADETTLGLHGEPISSIAKAVFGKYQQFLFDNNLVDFQDLLVLVLKLFHDFPQVLSKYQSWFKYVLVDEFQDTNDLQYEIVYLLAKNHRNLFIVGDEDQSIYAFRGANIQNIRKFMIDYPEHKKIILNQNYRSTNRILNAANQVIKNNKNRIPKNLFSELGEGNRLIHYKGETDEAEAYFIYTKIKQLIREGTRYDEIAVFYRNNAMSRKFEDVLLKYNVPHKVVGNLSFYKRKEIKDIIAYLRLVLNRGDDHAFERVYNEPKRGIGDASFERLQESARFEGVKLMDAIRPDSDALNKTSMDKFIRFKDMITAFQLSLESRNLLETYDDLLEKSGYMKMVTDEALMGDKLIEAERRHQNLQEFKTILLEKIKDYGELTNSEKLAIVLNELTLREEAEQNLKDDDFVSLMTMHTAKGLEFKVVFITCLEQTLFPSSQSLFEKLDVEEERRLFYVALTRAKQQIYLTNAEERFMYGHYAKNDDSEFLKEIPEDLLDRQGLAKKRVQATSYPRKPEPFVRIETHSEYRAVDNRLTIGDRVKHPVFGDGVVVMLENDKATIAFKAPVGIKILLKDHPSIQKAEV